MTTTLMMIHTRKHTWRHRSIHPFIHPCTPYTHTCTRGAARRPSAARAASLSRWPSHANNGEVVRRGGGHTREACSCAGALVRGSTTSLLAGPSRCGNAPSSTSAPFWSSRRPTNAISGAHESTSKPSRLCEARGAGACC